MFNIIAQSGKARIGEIHTAHGVVKTPAFLPCATHGALRSVGQDFLESIDVDILLANAYHLYLRPGIETIQKLGGLHRFMNWRKAILTDSGGFQAFALPQFVKFSDQGIEFRSHLDGAKHLFTPELVVEIQQGLGVDIATCLDVCTGFPASFQEVAKAVEQTNRWAVRSINARKQGIGNSGRPLKRQQHFRGGEAKRDFLESETRLPTGQGGERPLLYGMVQGSTYKRLRKKSAEFLAQLPFDGFAIGGNMYTFGQTIKKLAREKPKMWEVVQYTTDILPSDKPRHLLGVGEPADIIAGVAAGIDTFDCVMATRIARHGAVWVRERRVKQDLYNYSYHRLNLKSAQFATSKSVLDTNCQCPTCRSGYTRGYIRHLLNIGDPWAGQLLSAHNLYFLNELIQKIRQSIEDVIFNKKEAK